MMKTGQFSKVLFVTGFGESVAHAELIARFEEYGRILSTKLCLPRDPNDYLHNSYAFIEFESSSDATAARSKMHHARLFGCQLEVHFETKVPPPFRQMLGGPRRSHSREPRPASDHSPEQSPVDHRYPSERPYARYGSRAPPPYDRRDRPDAMRSTRGPPQPATAHPYSRPAYDERDGPRYRTPQRPPYRAYNAHRESADYGAGYNSRPRAPYTDRSPHKPDGYNPYHELRENDRRSVSPVRRNDRDGQEESGSGGSWAEDRPAQSHSGQANNRQRSRSRDPPTDRMNSGSWELEPVPSARPAQTPAESAAFNEDSLFTAP